MGFKTVSVEVVFFAFERDCGEAD